MAKDNKEEDPLTLDEAPDGDSKKKKIKKILIILIPIIIAIAGALYFFFFVIKAPKQEDVKQIEQSKTKEEVLLDFNTYLDIDPITVGLSPSGSKKEYLRLDLTLRLATEAESAAVMTKMPIIKDTLITFLRSLRATDFNSSSSTIYLREEISKRINKITSPITVKEVLFQEITIN